MFQLIFQNPSKQRALVEALLAPDLACSPTVIVGPSPRARFARIYRPRLGGLLALDVPVEIEGSSMDPVELGAAALSDILLSDRAVWREREFVLRSNPQVDRQLVQLFGPRNEYARSCISSRIAVYSSPATVPEGLELGEDWISCGGTPLQSALESIATAASSGAQAPMFIMVSDGRVYFGVGGDDWILVVYGPADECDLVLPSMYQSVILPACLAPILAMGPDAVSVDATGFLVGAQHAGLQCVAWASPSARPSASDPVAGSIVPVASMGLGASWIAVDARAEIKAATKAARDDTQARHIVSELGEVHAESLRRVLAGIGTRDVRAAVPGPIVLERQLAPGWTYRAALATY